MIGMRVRDEKRQWRLLQSLEDAQNVSDLIGTPQSVEQHQAARRFHDVHVDLVGRG
jgi:hypothetical protein